MATGPGENRAACCGVRTTPAARVPCRCGSGTPGRVAGKLFSARDSCRSPTSRGGRDCIPAGGCLPQARADAARGAHHQVAQARGWLRCRKQSRHRASTAAAGPPHGGRHAADARKSFLMVDHGGVHVVEALAELAPFARCPAAGKRTVSPQFGGVEDASGSGARCYRSPRACPHVGSAAKPWREIARPRCAPAPARPAAAPARAATAARCARCVPRCSNGGSPVAPHPGRRVVRRADTPTSSPTRKRPPARSTPGRRRRRRAPPGPRTRRRAPPGPCRQQAAARSMHPGVQVSAATPREPTHLNDHR
jgi:hypothetical protein